jgi:hypothetical protein
LHSQLSTLNSQLVQLFKKNFAVIKKTIIFAAKNMCEMMEFDFKDNSRSASGRSSKIFGGYFGILGAYSATFGTFSEIFAALTVVNG